MAAQLHWFFALSVVWLHGVCRNLPCVLAMFTEKSFLVGGVLESCRVHWFHDFCVSGYSCGECRSSHPTAIVDVVHAAGCHQLFIGVHAFDARGCHGSTETSTVTECQPELASPVYRRFSGLASICKMVTIADNHIRQPVLLM